MQARRRRYPVVKKLLSFDKMCLLEKGLLGSF